mmetsp:Transcript_63491/g.169861  ORF Transcript_63491/g.169861 Transcript_63491/m.169861 type:complete len:129 (-) Transcript_63491:484-870(-)
MLASVCQALATHRLRVDPAQHHFNSVCAFDLSCFVVGVALVIGAYPAPGDPRADPLRRSRPTPPPPPPPPSPLLLTTFPIPDLCLSQLGSIWNSVLQRLAWSSYRKSSKERHRYVSVHSEVTWNVLAL